jgi:hypothetical protein
MEISTGFIETHGFKKVNNSTWRNDICTLQSKYYSRSGNILDQKKAFRGCSNGKFKMMIETEDDFCIFMGMYGADS